MIRWDCRPLARASAVASLAFFAAAGNAPAAVTRDALLARWNHANPPAARLVERNVGTLATPPANLRALAARELASGYRLAPPQAAAVPAADKPWWMRLWTWLSNRLTQLWRAAFGSARLGRRGAIAIGDLLIAVAIGLIVVVAWRLLRVFAFERSRGESLELLAPPPDARALYDAACDRARQKDYAAASRLLFAAMVASPALLGAAIEDRSATVGELRRLLRQRDRTLLPPFDTVSAAFVTSAYAELPVDATQWEGARAGYVALRERESR